MNKLLLILQGSWLIILVFFFFSASSQVKNIPFNETLSWSGTSQNKTIEFEVKEGIKKLEIEVEGEITSGSLILNVFDVNQIKVSEFSLLTQKPNHKPSSYKSLSEKANRDLERERARAREQEKTREKSSSGSNSYSYSSSSNATSHSTPNSININTKKEASIEVTEANTTESHIRTKKQNESMIKTESNDKKSNGVIFKVIENPKPGIWKINIEIEEVSGKLTTRINQE